MLELAKVVNTHAAANAVDVLLLRNGQAIPMVQCLCDAAATNCGSSGLTIPTIKDSQNQYDPQLTNDRDIFAVVGFVGKRPVVLGFLYPQVSQMLFDSSSLNIRVRRDPSDVYSYTDDAGNTEFYHPSGTFLRIGVDAVHKDLTGLDLDGKWKIAKNTSTAVHVHLEVHNAGTLKATLDIDPSGNVSLTNSGALVAHSTGDATVQSDGKGTFQAASDLLVKSGTKVTIDAPHTYVTGTLDVTGNITGHADVSDSVRTMAADRVIYDEHKHGNVQNGTGYSDVPDHLQ